MESILIESVKEYLIKNYDCHSIILYGSFANGDYTDESDIDIACFCDNPEKENDTTLIENKQLDAWFYKTETMNNLNQFLHIREGKILFDKKNMCINFLKEVDSLFIMGPEKLTLEKKDFLKSWLRKMLNRAKKGDIEGNFRYHWLLTDALKIYFDIKGLWYLGPKKSLKWLYENDIDTYDVFNRALKVNTNINEVENLIEYIAAI